MHQVRHEKSPSAWSSKDAPHQVTEQAPTEAALLTNTDTAASMVLWALQPAFAESISCRLIEDPPNKTPKKTSILLGQLSIKEVEKRISSKHGDKI